MREVNLKQGDALEVLKSIPDDSVDSIVTDPPYGLGKEPDAMEMLKDWITDGHHDVSGTGFMGKKWDAFVPQPNLWKECLRVLKPGGHLLSFAGTRTQDIMGLGLRIAGFEIRDCVMWVFATGFPKSLDVSKAIDKAAGTEREVIGTYHRGMAMHPGNEGTDSWRENYTGEVKITAPASEAAKQWEGWGTALKPAYEPVIIARKPLVGTVAENVLKYGTGALNIDGCRVETNDSLNGGEYSSERKPSDSEWVKHGGTIYNSTGTPYVQPTGRWPANVIHDGSEEVVELFPDSKSTGGFKAGSTGSFGKSGVYGKANGEVSDRTSTGFGDSGSAARFFYCAKASRKDRDEGLEDFEEKKMGFSNGAQIHGEDYDKGQGIGLNRVIARKNTHTTVKPTELMRYLCKLVTHPSGTILDPFMGSGSTGKAAMLDGFNFIGIEMEEEYFKIAEARISHAKKQTEDKNDKQP